MREGRQRRNERERERERERDVEGMRERYANILIVLEIEWRFCIDF